MVPDVRSVVTTARMQVQAALAIHGLGIRGFDYSRTQKPQITRETCHFGAKLA